MDNKNWITLDIQDDMNGLREFTQKNATVCTEYCSKE